MISNEAGILGTNRCPTCGKHVPNNTFTFCSNVCRGRMEDEVRSASVGNNDLQTLMRQYKEKGWGPVD